MGETTTILKSTCRSCHGGCGVLLHVQGDRLVTLDLVYHPDRLKYPLRRVGARGSGKWERISWDEALDEISERLLAIRREFGAEAIALGTGTGRHHIRWVSRFGHALGTPNWCEPGFAQCFHPRVNTCILTFGDFPVSDYTGDVSPECIMFWGHNPTNSGPDGETRFNVLEALEHKPKIIVVDPRQTDLAKRAEVWLQIRPGDAHALYYRGRAWERLGSFQEAMTAYRESIAADPDNADARLHLGELLLHDQAAQEALEHYQRAHTLRPSDVGATLGLPRCQKALGNTAAARELLDGLLAEHRDNPRALAERGQLALEDENDPASAEQWLERAVAIDSADQEALYALTRALTMQGKHDKAKKWAPRLKQLKEDMARYRTIVRTVAKEPGNLELRTEAARICARLGRKGEARRWLETVLRIDPTYQPAHAAAEAIEEDADTPLPDLGKDPKP